MNSRKSSIAIAAIALLGAGAWWVMSRGDTQETAIPNEYQPSDPFSVVDVSPLSPQPAVIEGGSDSSRADEVPSTASAPAPVELPEKREFESRVDFDPALSRELETVVRRTLDAKLDRTRLDVESLICRGNSCQILFAPQPHAAGRGGMSAVSTILRDLDDADIRNPSTGVQLKPTVEMISPGRGENARLVAVIAFETR